MSGKKSAHNEILNNNAISTSNLPTERESELDHYGTIEAEWTGRITEPRESAPWCKE